MLTLLLIHASSTWFMVGLIWFVQIVHYPLFAQVGVDRFCLYSSTHQRATTNVVLAPMLIEAGAAIALLCATKGLELNMLTISGVVLLVVIWLSTWRLQVPCHQRLITGFDRSTHRSLVMLNWIRTVAWTIRGLIAIAMLSVAQRS